MEIDGEINCKRLLGEVDDDAKKKKMKTEQDAVEKMVAWLMMEQDAAVEELGDLLDSSVNPISPPVKFADNPYAPPVVFQPSAAYVTINGNEPMCGSSFSDVESSVMASIDTGALVSRFSGGLNLNGGGSREEGAWLDRDFLEGIYVKSQGGGGGDLFGTPPPPQGCTFANSANGGDGGGGGAEEDEMWTSFVVEDVFGESW